MSFRDTSCFRAGELHHHYNQWKQLAGDQPSPQQSQVLTCIRERVSVFDYSNPIMEHLKGSLTILTDHIQLILKIISPANHLPVLYAIP